MDLLHEWIYFMKNKEEVFSKFKEFKALIENHTERRSRPFDQIIAEKSHQMNSKTYAKNQGLRGSYPLHIIHNRLGLYKGILELSWKLQEKCFMIKIFLCIYR